MFDKISLFYKQVNLNLNTLKRFILIGRYLEKSHVIYFL